MKIRNIAYSIAIGSLLLSCGNGNEENKTTATQSVEVVPVIVATASLSSNSTAFSVSGQLVSEQSAAISTRMMGYITKMNVKIGDNVRAGQLLFSVQSTDIQAKSDQVAANIAAADAALANAQKDYERFKILHQQNSATDKELENITLQYKAAEAQAEAAKQMRNEVNANMIYANVTAPFSGTVTQKMMDAGSLASPGMPVLMLESADNLQAVAAVTEDMIKYIRQGMTVSVSIDAADKTVNGIVNQVSKSSVATGGQYLIKVNLTNSPDLLSGMYVHLHIPAGDAAPNNLAETIWIPQESLVKQGDLTGIYTIGTDSTATLRWLRIGKIAGSQVEILSGLTAGERYISKVKGRIWNGAKVQF
jgi:RND family efflux transporter MFP subunit